MNVSVLLSLKECHDNMTEAEQNYFELRALATRTTATLDGMPSGSATEHKKEDKVLKLIRAEDEYYSSVCNYIEQNAEAVRILEQADLNANEYTVLHMRLIHFQEWKVIAKETGQTLRNCQLLYKKALERINKS